MTSLDERNAEYWNSLCGWALARQVPISGDQREDLRRFDSAYLDYYPYLLDYLDPRAVANRDVLEIGLGYGTLGQLLAVAGARYVGVDVAAEPVELMRSRLELLGERANGTAIRASALDLPFESESFDFAYSIGCLHHTGDLQGAVEELHRVLRPGGTAVVMVYYAHSTRRFAHRLKHLARGESADDGRELYDVDPTGAAPPHTEYVSRDQARELFENFSGVTFEVRNFPDLTFRRFKIRRSIFLDNVAHVAGLDLYVRAVK